MSMSTEHQQYSSDRWRILKRFGALQRDAVTFATEFLYSS